MFTFKGEDLLLRKGNYTNGRIGLMLVTSEGYPYSNVTVNLVDELVTNENCVFLDTNNAPYIERFILKYKLGTPTGKMGISGFCTYPEYELDLNEVEKHLEECYEQI